MSSLPQNAVARPLPRFAGRNGMLDRYFYFAMSLLVAAIVVWGFSRTVGAALFHPDVPRPFLLRIHAVVFGTWVVCGPFSVQRVRSIGDCYPC